VEKEIDKRQSVNTEVLLRSLGVNLMLNMSGVRKHATLMSCWYTHTPVSANELSCVTHTHTHTCTRSLLE